MQDTMNGKTPGVWTFLTKHAHVPAGRGPVDPQVVVAAPEAQVGHDDIVGYGSTLFVHRAVRGHGPIARSSCSSRASTVFSSGCWKLRSTVMA